MKIKKPDWISPRLLVLFTLLSTALAVWAQTPVDADGKPLGPVYADDGSEIGAGAASDDFENDAMAAPDQGLAADESLLTTAELEALIGQIALYPDDLLAVVLPASTYPLQIVQAARYLEQRESDSSLQPDEEWDDSVVALLNYPEVLEMMSDDIDWTWRLGEAVVAQQGDVVAAVERFRDRAYAAGNLKTDKRQTVTRNDDDIIEIDPVEEDVIYVPYYEPERVVVYQREPVYHYYPRAYPVYYYPYPVGYHFASDYFWGVTTAFRIGWASDHLHVYHHSYHGHPYYGRHYYGSYWRRPSIQIFNTWYGGYGYASNYDRARYGSYWRPRRHGGARPGVHPNRDRYYSDRRRSRSEDGYADRNRDRDRRDYRREDRQYNSDERRRGAASTNDPRVARRANGDAASQRDAAPRVRNGENAENRRGTTPRLRNRDNAAERNSTPPVTGTSDRSGTRRAENRNAQDAGIRFRNRTADPEAASTRRRDLATGNNNTTRETARPRSRVAPATAEARTQTPAARQRAEISFRDRARSPGQVGDTRREPVARTTNRDPVVRQNPATPQVRATPETRRAVPQQRNAARQSLRNNDGEAAARQPRQRSEQRSRQAPAAQAQPSRRNAPAAARQSRQAAAPATRSTRQAPAPRARQAPANNPAPKVRNTERRSRSSDAAPSRSRGGDRRRQRD